MATTTQQPIWIVPFVSATILLHRSMVISKQSVDGQTLHRTHECGLEQLGYVTKSSCLTSAIYCLHSQTCRHHEQ